MSEIAIKNIIDEKLKKDYQVVIPYNIIEARIDTQVLEVKKTYKMKGFRPGQVPDNIIKDKYEKSIMAEESQKIIDETSKKIITENKLKLAIAPNIDVKVFEPKKDLEYIVSMELFPEVGEIDLAKIKLTKAKVKVEKSDVDDAVKRVTAGHKKWEKQEGSYAAKNGDTVNIDYLGKIDKVEFEGGAAKGHQLELGTKSFIGNFEEQLVGKKAGDKVLVKVQFPEDYHKASLAGKDSEFDVKVNSVLVASSPKIDDKFVKDNFGIENVAKLEELMTKQIENAYESMSRAVFKKELFELLNKEYDFELPKGLVDDQYNRALASIEEEVKRNPDTFKDDAAKEKAKKEQLVLSQKMVKNGIIFAEISSTNKISVSNEEVNNALRSRIAQYPGQEKQIQEYYQKNPTAIQDVKGGVLEEKVIDLILKKGQIADKEITSKELEVQYNAL